MSIPIRIVSANGSTSVYTQRQLALEINSIARAHGFKKKDITESFVRVIDSSNGPYIALHVYFRRADGLIDLATSAL